MLKLVWCLLLIICAPEVLFASEISKKPTFRDFYFSCLFKNSAMPVEEFTVAARNNAQPLTLEDWKVIQERRNTNTKGFDQEALSSLYKADFSADVPKQSYAHYFLSLMATRPAIGREVLTKRLAEDFVAQKTDADTRKITLIKEILTQNMSPELFPNLYKSETLFPENNDLQVTPREPQWVECPEHICKCSTKHLVKNRRAPWLSHTTLAEYEKKDRTRLENLCKEALKHPELLPFIQQACHTYALHYGKTFDFYDVAFDDTQTIRTYLKSKPELSGKYKMLTSQNTYEMCPCHKPSWLKRLVIGGTMLGVSYLWYKWYTNKTPQKIAPHGEFRNQLRTKN